MLCRNSLHWNSLQQEAAPLEGSVSDGAWNDKEHNLLRFPRSVDIGIKTVFVHRGSHQTCGG